MSGGETPAVPRQDLALLEAEPGADGAPAWMLHDPLTGRYFRIGREEMELLAFLDGGDAETVAAAAARELGEAVTPARVEALFKFLRLHNLAEGDARQQTWYAEQRGRRPGRLAHFAKSYLFIRVPLVRPDRFLDRTLPYARRLVAPGVVALVAACALFGLLLALRQVDAFFATFPHFFTPAGMLAFAVALFAVKAMHELGHAYVAKAYGCRVPVMGVALLVLWPVLYTDTTDAWRLSSRKRRMHIAAAGMAVELAVAAVSLLAWSLAPDGVVRSVLFILATTTWVMSLAVNLNPLMRFDAYYLLSDAWGVPNLEARSHALARWWLRERLFGLGEAPPERPRRRMIVYAFAVWIYRFLLFLGIALLVYHFFFKLLGIVLFAVEIVYFILAPIGRELREWGRRRRALRWNRSTLRTTALLAAVAVLAFVPWRGSVEAPAELKAPYQLLYVPESGRLARLEVANGERVESGRVVAVVKSAELEFETAQARRRYQELLWQRAALGFDARLLDRALVIASELRTQNQRLRGLAAREERLVVSAPWSGEVVELPPDLRAGQWLGEGEPLLALVSTEHSEVTAYLAEDLLRGVEPGRSGRFYPEGGGRAPFDVTVAELEQVGLRRLESPYVASLFGGALAVRESDDGGLIPAVAAYRARLVPREPIPLPERVLRGIVVIEGEPESVMARIYRRVVAVLVRESGF